jgi:hypothetical protein
MNNIFLNNSKSKYNPDVIKLKEEYDKTRQTVIFKKSNETYNSITNNIPTNIKSQKDLELNKDTKINNLDSIILQKKNERELQDSQLKPIKKKFIQDTKVNNCLDFNELKVEQTQYTETHTKNIEINKNKYNDIMSNLKDLGIIN